MKDVIHKCEFVSFGSRTRILAYRHNCRALLADFDVCVIQQPAGKPPILCGEFTITDFARGAGVDRLFALILDSMAPNQAATDENGQVVPLPERTPAGWEEAGRKHLMFAARCFLEAGSSRPELVRTIGQVVMGYPDPDQPKADAGRGGEPQGTK